jgi:hypothetical protein
MHVGGGGATRHVRGGGAGVTYRHRGRGATTHISTESFDEASSWCEGGGTVRRWLKLPTSYKREGGGVVRWRLELPTSWHEGGGAVRLEGEGNRP